MRDCVGSLWPLGRSHGEVSGVVQIWVAVGLYMSIALKCHPKQGGLDSRRKCDIP
jgi:hypothetical protein